MLLVEDQGVRVFDSESSQLRAREVISKSRVQYAIPVTKPDGKTLELDDGDLEMVDSEAANGMKNTQATDGVRKRKGTMNGLEIPVKFVKYHFDENSVKEKFHSLSNGDGLSSEGEMGNSISMET